MKRAKPRKPPLKLSITHIVGLSPRRCRRLCRAGGHTAPNDHVAERASAKRLSQAISRPFIASAAYLPVPKPPGMRRGWGSVLGAHLEPDRPLLVRAQDMWNGRNGARLCRQDQRSRTPSMNRLRDILVQLGFMRTLDFGFAFRKSATSSNVLRRTGSTFDPNL